MDVPFTRQIAQSFNLSAAGSRVMFFGPFLAGQTVDALCVNVYYSPVGTGNHLSIDARPAAVPPSNSTAEFAALPRSIYGPDAVALGARTGDGQNQWRIPCGWQATDDERFLAVKLTSVQAQIGDALRCSVVLDME